MKIWRLEAVRGAAAAYVVVAHSFTKPPLFFSFGQEAVMAFFLLSGFVIEYSSARHLNRGFGAYFSRRFWRIYSVLVCLFVVAAILEHSPISSPAFWRQLGGNLLMLQDFPEGKPAVLVPAIFAGALWSLGYEWWFYMLYFPAATRLRPARQVHVVGWIGVAAALSYLVYPNFINRILFYFPAWWAGVALARQYGEEGRVTLKSARAPGLYLAAICAVLAAPCLSSIAAGGRIMPGLHPFLEFRHLFGALVLLAAALGWQRLRWIGFSSLLGWGRWVAPISYALYIAHEPLFSRAHYLHGVLPAEFESLAYLVCLLIFCGIAELWLYRRIIRPLAA